MIDHEESHNHPARFTAQLTSLHWTVAGAICNRSGPGRYRIRIGPCCWRDRWPCRPRGALPYKHFQSFSWQWVANEFPSEHLWSTNHFMDTITLIRALISHSPDKDVSTPVVRLDLEHFLVVLKHGFVPRDRNPSQGSLEHIGRAESGQRWCFVWMWFWW